MDHSEPAPSRGDVGLGSPFVGAFRGRRFRRRRVETRGIGEVGDDVIRKAIAIQHESKTFWTVLALFGDFIVEPLGLAVRAGTVAVFVCRDCVATWTFRNLSRRDDELRARPGLLVLGLAVRTALSIGLRRAEIETSPTLLLTSGTHSGASG